MNAIAYVRVSTSEQELSPAAQAHTIDEWAKREGVEIVAYCIDRGVSGGTPVEKRDGLLLALQLLRERSITSLVIAKRDRLARDVVVAAVAERMVQDRGAKIVSADGVANGDGPESQLMKTILDAFAQYERALIRARTKSALAEKARRGEVRGEIPFGFRRAGARLVRNETEQTAIARAKELSARGLPQRAICTQLAIEGFVSRSGHPLQQGQINRLIRFAA